MSFWSSGGVSNSFQVGSSGGSGPSGQQPSTSSSSSSGQSQQEGAVSSSSTTSSISLATNPLNRTTPFVTNSILDHRRSTVMGSSISKGTTVKPRDNSSSSSTGLKDLEVSSVGCSNSEEEELQIDNSAMVREKIAKLYAERLLCDITLNVGGSSFPAHRLILCASSDVFQVMLMNPNWSESQETTVVLQEDPACARIFADFLKYLYTGKIHINHNSVLPLLTLADKYNVEDLICLCLDYMQCHLVSAFAHGQLVSWLQYTLFCGHEAVASSCQDFIKWNFQMVADGTDFGNMEVDVLVSFLLSSDLVIYHEMALFQCVTHWLALQEKRHFVQHRGSSDEWERRFANLVYEVMSHVRFPMLSPHQLAELLLSPLVSKFNSFFLEKMGDAMSFHSPGGSGAERVGRLTRSHEGRLLLTPRLYTAETWGALLTIEDFASFPTYGVRTLVFSSPAGLSESEAEPTLEWSVDLYPKGVWFKKFYLIAWHGTMELSESVVRSVRLSILSRTSHDSRIHVAVLLYCWKDGVEHVGAVMQKTFVFSADERILNIDHLVPFDDLNGFVPTASSSSSSSSSALTTNNYQGTSSHLVGPRRDTFKLHIILTPAAIWM